MLNFKSKLSKNEELTGEEALKLLTINNKSKEYYKLNLFSHHQSPFYNTVL